MVCDAMNFPAILITSLWGSARKSNRARDLHETREVTHDTYIK